MLLLKRPLRSAKWFILLAATVLIVGTNALADPIPYEFRIDTVNNAALSEEPVYVSINKVAGSDPVYGFDILIGYDSGLVSLADVFPGELIAGGIMEYFEWRTGPAAAQCPTCPTHMIRIVGLYEINDGTVNPHPAPTGNGQFLELVFSVAPGLEDTHYVEPLRFLWMDCGDNAIAYSELGQIVISDHVFSAGGYEITDPTAAFPTLFGTPDTCLAGQSSPPTRMIDFHDGYIANSDDMFWIGDININGIACEIADWVTFYGYFMRGLAAFTVNVELQIAATDVNTDGLPLTYADFVWLFRTIEGLVPPLKSGLGASGSGVIEIMETGDSLVIRGDFTIPVGVLALDFSAPGLTTEDIEITLLPDAAHIGYGYEVVDGRLHLLIFDQDFEDLTLADGSLPPGQISILSLKSTGDLPVISSAGAAGFWGESITVSIGDLANRPPEFMPYPSIINNDSMGIFTHDFNALDFEGDPLTFHMVSGVGNIDSLTGIYTFGGTCCPMDTMLFIEICVGDALHPCPQADPQLHAAFALLVVEPTPLMGDVDQNRLVDVLDIVVLIQYKYQGGLPPVPIESGDIDRNGVINVLDIIELIDYKFKSGPEPSCH